MKIPLSKPWIEKEEIDAVRDVLESGWLAHGPKTKEFEEKFADYIGVKYAVSMNSCASALQIALMCKGIKGEVILPSFTFPASANAIINSGAKPVFADIEDSTCTIDPSRIEELVSGKTKAIMPVHFAGKCCDMGLIEKIAEKYDLEVIEDSAEAIGAEFNGKKSGSFGTGCFSFYPVKNITTGEGGMLTTNEEEIANKARILSSHGISSFGFPREREKGPWSRIAEYPGYNYRMCDILAAIGLVQLKKIEKMNRLRKESAEYLIENLKSIEGIVLPYEEKNKKDVYQMFPIRVKESGKRDNIIKKLRERGIYASTCFYPPLHIQQLYQKYPRGIMKATEDAAKSMIIIPFYPQIKKEEMDYMIKKIKELVKI